MTTKPKAAISRKAPAYAIGFAGSFATYLLPVFGRHFTHRPWGPLLLEEIDRYPAGGAAGWFAGDLTLALVLQAAAALLLYRLVRRPGWLAIMAVVASIPAFIVILNVAHGGRFPPPFPIEADSAREQADWEAECSVSGYQVSPAARPVRLSLERARQAWLRRAGGDEYALLRMPGCEITEVSFDIGEYPHIAYAAPNGRMLYVTKTRPDWRTSWWYWPGPGSELRPLAWPRQPDSNPPVLSDDGEWIGRLEFPESKSEQPFPRIFMRSLSTDERITVDFKPLDNAHFPYRLLSFDMDQPEIVLRRGLSDFLGLDLEGNLRWGPIAPAGANALDRQFRRVADGWVAWGGSDQDGSDAIVWTMRGESGSHTVLRGRKIHSVAIEPERSLIAVSVSCTYCGHDVVRDAVYIFRVSDGLEVFRKSLKRRKGHIQIQFLGTEFFAYPAGGELHVLRIPQEATANNH